MKYKAKVSFGGLVANATAGSVIELTDKAVIADLLGAGYIEEIDKAPTTATAPVKKVTKKTAKKE